MMDRDLDTLPTARPMGSDRAKRLVDAGLPVPGAGQGGQVLELAGRFRSLVSAYPKTRRWVRQSHPDIQSPMDATEMIFGSGIFLAVYDEGDAVKDLLRLVADTWPSSTAGWKLQGPNPTSTWGTGNSTLRIGATWSKAA